MIEGWHNGRLETWLLITENRKLKTANICPLTWLAKATASPAIGGDPATGVDRDSAHLLFH
ncbi:MAG: hypothetical protein NTV22_19590 [bacterium]|nr:hypothetical protein [bacterium]